MRGEHGSAYEFGPFRLDPAEQQLLRDGRGLPLTPKVFQVLCVLVQNSGRLVEKDKLLTDVWGDSFVEEGALSRSVSILRKTLNGDGAGQTYIETVPKRGYRFVALVTEHAVNGAPPPLVVPASSVPSRWAGAAAVVLLGAVLAIVAFTRSTGNVKTPGNVVPVHKQLTFTGKEGGPTISPDGRRIAYISFEKPQQALVVRELSGGAALTIFTAPDLGYLRWSPDGTELLVWARGAGKNGIYVVPELGGTSRLIAPGGFYSTWSPDGSTIAVPSQLDGKIWFFDKTGHLLRTTSLRDVNWTTTDIDWSSSGVLALVSRDYHGRHTLWTVNPDGTEQRRLFDADADITVVRWSRDGKGIYFFRRQNQTFSLFKLSTAGGSTQAVPTTVIAGLESDRFFALSADEKRLVYARAPYSSNLWVAELHDTRGTVTTRQLTTGTSLVERPSVSPDGRSVVFNVGHEPATNLYAMPLTGGTPRQLTFLDSLNLKAVWSPDGTQIAFASNEGGSARVWTMAAGGGVPQARSSADLSDTFDLTWAPGARVLYQQAGNQNYYELDPQTRSERLLVNDSSTGWIFWPVYSPDARKVAAMWTRRPKRGVWVIDIADRRETLVYPTSADLRPLGWSADGRAIYFLEGKSLKMRGRTAPLDETMTDVKIVRVAADGAHADDIAVLPFGEIGGVSMAPDGRSFVCAVYTSGTDVWVVENFDATLK